jgi:cell division protein FtsQ
MPQVKKTRTRHDPQGRPQRQPRRAPPSRSRQTGASSGASSGWSMKLGAWAHARMRQVDYDPRLRAGLGIAAATLVGLVFVAVMVASGMARDIGQGIATAAAGAARSAGLAVDGVDVQARGGFALTDLQRAEAADVAAIEANTVMFSLNPADVRDRVMSLPWVESVTVRRLWPDRVQILIEPRPAVAVWQHGGTLAFFDARGRLLTPASAGSARGFALVIGPGAPQAAPALFQALGERPQIARRTAYATRVGGRRWTLALRNGTQVLLPETGAGAALDRLASLQDSHRLLDRPLARIDLRADGRLFIRKGAEAPASTATGGV